MRADSSGIGIAKAPARSRITNGGKLLPNVDGRSMIGRRLRDLIAQITADQGGSDRMSEARLQLIRRFSAASVIAEFMESKLANGEQIDLTEHALLCSTLVRLAGRIGIDRRLRDVTPYLADYIENVSEDEDEQESE